VLKVEHQKKFFYFVVVRLLGIFNIKRKEIENREIKNLLNSGGLSQVTSERWLKMEWNSFWFFYYLFRWF
jgi:hypothetical protein